LHDPDIPKASPIISGNTHTECIGSSAAWTRPNTIVALRRMPPALDAARKSLTQLA